MKSKPTFYCKLSYFGCGVIDDLFGAQVTFVTNQELVDVFACIAIDFLEPLLDIVERLLVSTVVDDNDTMGTSVITRSDCPESLLTSSVPLYQ